MDNCKCIRCGKTANVMDGYIVLWLGPETMNHGRLCEQCYQTIKEVLEDGEIK